MTRNTHPHQLEKRYILYALYVEVLVCVQSGNGHKTGVKFINSNIFGIYLFFSYCHGFNMKKI